MIKITLVVFAALNAATAVAQTISGEVKNNAQAHTQVTNSNHGSEVNASAKTTTSISASGEYSNHGMAVRESAKKTSEGKAQRPNKDQAEIDNTFPEPETREPSGKRERKYKNRPETYGQDVYEVANDFQTTALVESKSYAANHGQAVAAVAHQTEFSAKKSSENSIDATNDMVQDGKNTSQDQGKEVKKVARAKRQGKPEKVEAEAGAQIDGTAKGGLAGRPQTIAGAGAARVKGGASRPVRVLKPSAAGGSGTIGGGVIGKGVGVGIGVGAKTKIKIGN